MINKKKTLLSLLGILLLVLVTIGVTFALFTYTKLGTTENTVTTGTLKFLYTENTGVGNGINISDALPVSDQVGKNYSTENYVFDFSVEATNSGIEEIPYEVTLRKKNTSTLPESNIKVYLTDMTEQTDTKLSGPIIYNNLNQTDIDVGEEVEKTIYYGTVLGGELNYKKDFRLRMWINEGSNYDSIAGKTFTILVNVYANANLINNNVTTYKEALLNGADPVLESSTTLAKGDTEVVRIAANENNTKLTPVIIAEDGSVTKADITKEWYKYEKQKWANAIITRDSYKKLNDSGKVVGATLNNGYVTFDGIDDYINLGLENYDFGNSITMGITVKLNKDSDKQQCFFGNWEGSGGGLCQTVDNKVTGYLYINNGYATITSTSLSNDEYYTLVLMYNGSELALYINGVKNVSREVTGSIVKAKAPIFLGANPVPGTNLTGSEYADVNVKESIIYNHSMTEEEIKKGFTDGIKLYSTDSLLSYMNFTNEIPENNEIILEDNIESYFVWIPRYRYKIFDEGNYTGLTSKESKEQKIEIVFEGKRIIPSNGTTVGDYLTHPAFTSFNSNGFWAGKFETGYNGAETKQEAQVNAIDTEKIVIKPNVYSWRGITLGKMFKNGYDYERNLNSHMMKNTEWGAVAYLGHSSYGSQASVRINNNSSFITGYSSVVEPTMGATSSSKEGNRFETTLPGSDGTYTRGYFNASSGVSSVNGNKSGVYDMSGGSHEFTMGYEINATADSSEIKSLYNDFFNNTSYTKYWDKYVSPTPLYSNRILGDATGEMGPFYSETDSDGNVRSKSSWYKDLSAMIYSKGPWFHRGNSFEHGSGAGVFSFNRNQGDLNSYIGYRIVLTPQ